MNFKIEFELDKSFNSVEDRYVIVNYSLKNLQRILEGMERIISPAVEEIDAVLVSLFDAVEFVAFHARDVLELTVVNLQKYEAKIKRIQFN